MKKTFIISAGLENKCFKYAKKHNCENKNVEIFLSRKNLSAEKLKRDLLSSKIVFSPTRKFSKKGYHLTEGIFLEKQTAQCRKIQFFPQET